MVKIERIYDLPSKDDGKRILVDRLWLWGYGKKPLRSTNGGRRSHRVMS